MGTIVYAHKNINVATGCRDGLPCWHRCWARQMARRLSGRHGYPEMPFEFRPTWHESAFNKALRPHKPARICLNFMGDIAEQTTDAIGLSLGLARRFRNDRYLWLTKRPGLLAAKMQQLGLTPPLPNVWIGTSVGNQDEADERVPELLAGFPGWNLWVSVEPMLSEVRLSRGCDYNWLDPVHVSNGSRPAKLSFCVLGGESGPGARPMHPDWARTLRDECKQAGVPFWFKQWGEWLPDSETLDMTWTVKDGHPGAPVDFIGKPVCNLSPGLHAFRVGKKVAGDYLDGKQHHELPQELLMEWEKTND